VHELYRPELTEDSTATRAIFAIGHAIGDFGRLEYDPKSTGATMTIFEKQRRLSALSNPAKERKPISGEDFRFKPQNHQLYIS
jgi:hypothetical protein